MLSQEGLASEFDRLETRARVPEEVQTHKVTVIDQRCGVEHEEGHMKERWGPRLPDCLPGEAK